MPYGINYSWTFIYITQLQTMVLEYAHLHLPKKWHSFVGVHIPAAWVAIWNIWE
jgi:hypothetical protein